MGFEMLGINVERDSKPTPRNSSSATPVSFPILFDPENKVSGTFGVSAMPTTFLIDRQGRLRWHAPRLQAGRRGAVHRPDPRMLREKHEAGAPCACRPVSPGRERLLAPRALGEALRAAELRGPDHGLGSRSGLLRLHQLHVYESREGARGAAATAAAAAATDRIECMILQHRTLFFLLAGLSTAPRGRVLPDDRADLHVPPLRRRRRHHRRPVAPRTQEVRGEIRRNASYYVDMVSSASIDVITTASPYKEERTQYGLGFEYCTARSRTPPHSRNSSENDYDADTASIRLSQDMFGDLTTVSLSVHRGWDDVPRRGDDDVCRPGGPAYLWLDVSQIVTPEPDAGPVLRARSPRKAF